MMYNYFGIGLDAKFCLGFHNLREKKPHLFQSRVWKKSRILKKIENVLNFKGSKMQWREYDILKNVRKIEVRNKH